MLTQGVFLGKVKVIWRHLANANKTPYRGRQGPTEFEREALRGLQGPTEFEHEALRGLQGPREFEREA